MKHYINKDALVVELNRLIAELVEEGEDTMFEQGRISAFEDVKVFINHTLEVKEVKEEPVSNDLEEAIKKYLKSLRKSHFEGYDIERAFEKGAKWQKEQMEKEVDLEKEFDNYANGILACDIQFEPFTHLHNCAKHFFELGLKAKGKQRYGKNKSG